ncbi:MAG: hypothetical protein HIU83_02890 [Proteobacteria bacterium]|nr:hypothetical protein [Pseudomonadota bacterium]
MSKQNGITVEVEFIASIKQAARVMLEATAGLNNELRKINRDCPHTDDAVLMAAMRQIKSISDDLSGQWAELDLDFAEYNF